jgi:hypothetical protein
MQIGGDPDQLDHILESNVGTCISSDPEGCTPLINAIDSYIGENFINQNATIPLGGVTLGESISDYGLDPGQTTLTPEALAAQSWILGTLFSFENWLNALIPLVYGTLTLDDIFLQEIENYFNNLEIDVIWITTGSNMEITPQNCFAVDPLTCTQCVQDIIQALETYNVTRDQLTTLFQPIKYTYTLECAFDFKLYPLGNWDYVYEDVKFAVTTQNFSLQNGSFRAKPITISLSEATGAFDYEEYDNESSAYQIMEVKYDLNAENDGETLNGTIAVYKTNGDYFNFCPGTASNTTTAIGSLNPYWSNFTEVQVNVTSSRGKQIKIVDH